MYFLTRVSTIEGLESFDTLMETLDSSMDRGDTEVLGYFESIEDVEEVIDTRIIDRISYPHGYLVIEKIESGVLPRVETIRWYKYDEVEEEYKHIEDVESIVVNFAEIG